MKAYFFLFSCNNSGFNFQVSNLSRKAQFDDVLSLVQNFSTRVFEESCASCHEMSDDHM